MEKIIFCLMLVLLAFGCSNPTKTVSEPVEPDTLRLWITSYDSIFLAYNNVIDIQKINNNNPSVNIDCFVPGSLYIIVPFIQITDFYPDTIYDTLNFNDTVRTSFMIFNNPTWPDDHPQCECNYVSTPNEMFCFEKFIFSDTLTNVILAQ